jgi:hypothetical protein
MYDLLISGLTGVRKVLCVALRLLGVTLCNIIKDYYTERHKENPKIHKVGYCIFFDFWDILLKVQNHRFDYQSLTGVTSINALRFIVLPEINRNNS